MATRKEASALTTAEKNRYKNLITQMLQDPSNPYGKLVAIHGNMNHHQHSGMSGPGTQRFLPWHRAFLLHFEKKLQSLDSHAFIPYWDWTKSKSVPAWIRTFKPQVFVPGHGTIVVKRNAKIPAKKNVTAIMAQAVYTPFTDQLENGPHGEVHMELGVVNGIREAMGDIRISPADPIFWLHHAQIDRLWSVWQANHPGLGPTLTGANAVMDPWTDTVAQLNSIQQLGYNYA